MVMKSTSNDKVIAVKAADLSKQTAQSDNLPRVTGVDSPTYWMGRVTGEAGKVSGAHHHGEAETAGYILSGRTRIYYGENYKEYVDLEPGDFLYVPPYIPHIEETLSETEPVVFITSRTKGNIVVNLDVKDTSVFSKKYDEIIVVRANELNEAEESNRKYSKADRHWIRRTYGRAVLSLHREKILVHTIMEKPRPEDISLADRCEFILVRTMKNSSNWRLETFSMYLQICQHIERNMSDTEPVVFVTSRHPGNIVVNLNN